MTDELRMNLGLRARMPCLEQASNFIVYFTSFFWVYQIAPRHTSTMDKQTMQATKCQPADRRPSHGATRAARYMGSKLQAASYEHLPA